MSGMTFNDVFETAGGGVVDADVQADASDITSNTGGTRLAIVVPSTIAASVTPGTDSPLNVLCWMLASWWKAQRTYNATHDDVEAIKMTIRSESANSATAELTFTITLSADIDDFRNTFAANVDDEYPA